MGILWSSCFKKRVHHVRPHDPHSDALCGEVGGVLQAGIVSLAADIPPPPDTAAVDNKSFSNAKSPPYEIFWQTTSPPWLNESPREVQLKACERGVAVSFLLRLADEPGGIDPSWTIHQVVDRFVKPATKNKNCSLHELIPIEYVGKPSIFVSHTWSRTYSGLMEMLSNGLHDMDCFVWLDICCLNQNAYNEKNRPEGSGLHQEDKDNLEQAIRGTEKTLFCLDDELTSISRIWCMFEVWQAFNFGRGGTKLQAYVSEGARQAIRKDPGETTSSLFFI